MVDILFALVIPVLVMLVIMRISFSVLGSSIVTWMIMLFAFGVHKHWLTAIIALLSFVGGLMLIRKKARWR